MPINREFFVDKDKSEENSSNDGAQLMKLLDDMLSDKDQENDAQDQPNDDEDADEDGSDESVTDKIVSHLINRSSNPKHADYGEKLYHVRWNG